MIVNKKFIIIISFASLGSFLFTSDFCFAVVQQSAPTITNYTYDPSGQRIMVSSGSKTTVYPTKNYNTDGANITKHIFANGADTATIQGIWANAKVYYNHTDSLNSSSVMTDSVGTVAETMDYYPFGALRMDNKTSTFNEQRKYIGQEFDADTGLNYLNARYYNSSLAKFISQDPMSWNFDKSWLSDPQTQNSYSYARNNPITLNDPTGEFAFLTPALFSLIPAITAASAFIATNPALTGMIGNAVVNRPTETSVRMAPIVGDIISGMEAVTGKDAFSGESLSWINRGLSAVSILPFIAVGRMKAEERMSKFELRVAKTEHNWGNANTLQRHFNDHGSDFGAKNPLDYARKTDEFVNNKQYTNIFKEGKDTVYWNKDTNLTVYKNQDNFTKSGYKLTNENKINNYQRRALKEK